MGRRPNSEYVTADGEPTPGAPSYIQALILLTEIERKFKGALLRIRELEIDRHARALDNPHRGEVEVLHKLWKAATHRRRPLDTVDREQMGRAVKRFGFNVCVRAIAGAAYDPTISTRRNGSEERHNDLELIFRTYAHVTRFAERAPRDWKPDAQRIAKIGGGDG